MSSSPTLQLADGETVTVQVPSPPAILVGPPAPPTAAVVVVEGPRGPAGNETDLTVVDNRLDALEQSTAGPRGYVHHQDRSATLWQIVHDLPYAPGGITVVELDGTPVEYASITWPLPGVVELTFGVPFAGTATLS